MSEGKLVDRRVGSRRRYKAGRRAGLGGLLAVVIAFCGSGAASALPPGWGHEMVTPPDKGGNSVAVFPGLASPAGDSIAYPVASTFSASHPQGNSLPDPYVSTRGKDGWRAPRYGGAPVDPLPGAAGLMVVSWGISQDLSRTVQRTNAAIGSGSWPGTTFPTGMLPLYVRDNVADTYRLLTPQPFAGAAPYTSAFAWGSANLDRVLIETQAVLTAEAASLPTSAWKLYLWDEGEVSLASKLPDGTASAGAAGPAFVNTTSNFFKDNAISDDGRVIWFSSMTPQTAEGPSLDDAFPARPNQGENSTAPLYRREGDQTVLVNREENAGATIPVGPAAYRGATPDGQKVLFTTEQSLVDADVPDDGELPGLCSIVRDTDLYMYTHSDDPDNDENLTLLSRDLGPRHEVLGVLGRSEDGSRVYFVTKDSCNAQADPAIHIYLWDDGELDRIGVAPNAAALAGRLRPDETQASPWVRTAGFRRGLRTVSGDGSALLLISTAQLDSANPSGDTGGFMQVFRYGIGDGWTCLSCPPDGAATTASVLSVHTGNIPFLTSIWADQARDRRNLSFDGDRAFFVAGNHVSGEGDALVAGDVNGKPDVYMWENGEYSLISTGRSGEPSFFMDASENGDSAFFVTWEPISRWDRDGLGDVYAARVGGGLPEPPTAAKPCSGVQCQRHPAPQPAFEAPASGVIEDTREADRQSGRPLSLLSVTHRQRDRLASGKAVRLRMRAPGRGAVRVTLQARLDGRRRTVAAGRVIARRAGVVTARVRLSRRARKQLVAGRHLKVQIIVRAGGESDRALLRLVVRHPVGRDGRR